MPRPRASRSRMLLVGLPMFAVFAAFGAIVWLAYEHGTQGPPIGEPPLIKAPALAIKLPPEEAGSLAVAEQGEVRDLLSDTPQSDRLEQLLPPPEQPQTPVTAAETPAPVGEPDDGSGDVAAVAPPDTGGPAPNAATPPPAPPQPAPAQAAPPQPAPAQAAPAQPAPAQAAPAQVATAPAEPPRQAPLAVERQSAAETGARQPSSAPQPTPKEAEAALDALLAEVTGAAEARPTPPATNGVQAVREPSRASPAPAPSTVSELPPPPTVAAPPARLPAPPPTVSPFTPPATDVTAITPDQASTRRPTGAVTPTTTAPPSSSPSLEPAPSVGNVAALEGNYRIQLAAVRAEADARRAWDLFLVDLGPVLRGVQPFIERAETANGTFYRVQIGPFASLQAAESLCDELKRRNASCFVIRR